MRSKKQIGLLAGLGLCATLSVGLMLVGVYYSTFTPTCTGVAATDTAAFTSLINLITAAGRKGTLKVPYTSTQCKLNNLTIPAGVTLDFASNSSGIYVVTGQTVTIVGPVVAPPKQSFFNATAGQGTVSFSGNHVVTEAYPEWWGGGAGVAAATNGAALNATNAALVTMLQGTIVLGPGIYDFNVPLFLGDDNVAFTTISLRGSGTTRSWLRWQGSTSARAVSITKGRDNRIYEVSITNGVAYGTTIGLYIGGPAGYSGTATHAVHISDTNITNFHIGEQMGDAGGTTAASEVVHVNVDYLANDIGFLLTSSGNSLSPWFFGCGSSGNNQRGFDFETGGAGHFYGGDMGHQPITFWVGTGGTALHVDGVRFELNEDDQIQGGGGANEGGSYTYIGCETEGQTTTKYLFDDGLGNGAIGNYTFIGNMFVNPLITKIILPNNGSGGGGSLLFSGNYIGDETGNIFATNTNSAGVTYTLQNNTKTHTRIDIGKWPEEKGFILGGGTRTPISQITWNGSSSATQQLFYLNRLLATNIVAPSTPGSGLTELYVDSTTKTFKAKNDAGILSTTVIADTGTSNNFLTAISAGGVISKAQPASTNLSDTANLGRLNAANTWALKQTLTLPLIQAEGAVLSVGSNTITPTSAIHHVGAGLIKTITVPSGFTSGTIYFIPDSAFTYDGTSNIVLPAGGGTAVVGRVMAFTYSSSTSKWYPSY